VLCFRFAQFFISPLISADGVEREVKAVDSEHGKNLNVDAWRLHQLAKATANQDHAWSHFFTGVPHVGLSGTWWHARQEGAPTLRERASYSLCPSMFLRLARVEPC
jgi:hypothetical protein